MKKAVVSALILLTFFLFLEIQPALAQYAELVGKEVELKTFEGKEPIYLGTSEKAFNHLTGNVMGSVKREYRAAMLNLKGFEVENRTRARILEVDFWQKAAKVEIIDGPRHGWVGWVLLQNAVGY